jgi:L-ribulose-5-phosphate 3-epimerase
MESVSRRQFLQAAIAAGAVASMPSAATAQGSGAFRGQMCFFSKHLPRMHAQRLGRTLKQLGFDGVDLTVRPKGHIEPARVAQDLPPFVAGLKDEGMPVPMITTELLSDADPAARPTLETAAALKIPFFKPGYYRYPLIDVRKELDTAMQQLRTLAALSAQQGVRLGFHNHSGNYIGSPVWDIVPTIDSLDPRWAGYYFDVRHAVVEGGDAGWRAAFNLVAPRLLMIAVKDFYWEKTAKGWRVHNCPLGEGMVDWTRYCAMLAKANFHGPVSLHLEYEIPGATPEAEEENTIAATAKDLAFLKARFKEAYASAGSAL